MVGYRAYTIKKTVFAGSTVIVGLRLISADGNDADYYDSGRAADSSLTKTYYCFDGSTIDGWKYTLDSNGYLTDLWAFCKIQKCNAGFYPSVNGLDCLNCPIGTFSLAYSSSCTQCSNGGSGAKYTSSALENACTFDCNAGYGYVSNRCAICEAGSYKSSGTNVPCTLCPVGKYSSSQGAVGCNDCVSGVSYQDFSGKTECLLCTTPYLNTGFYAPLCTATSNPDPMRCPSCDRGKELIDPVCWGFRGRTTTPQCKSCPAGKVQTTGYDSTNSGSVPGPCVFCNTGLYTNTIGSFSCTSCTNLPVNGAFMPWTTLSDSPSCPYKCNAGYGTTASSTSCSSCPTGFYNPENFPPKSCSACTIKPRNSYFLSPVIFTRDSDACPWDCNAGYEKNAADGTCVPCASGFYNDVLRIRDDTAPNYCRKCTECTLGVTYQTRVCSSTQDRICTACLQSCNRGYYKTQCTLLEQTKCDKCNSLLNCKQGQYIVGDCDGTTTEDTSLCKNCSLPSICPRGLFMRPNQCTGRTTQDSNCQVCQVLSCPFGSYQQACNGYNDTTCAVYTQCQAGVTTLRNRGPFNDGSFCLFSVYTFIY